jgi:hypothetical protein
MVERYARNLDQTCHECGLTEAAGDYCTRCGTNTVHDWHPVEQSEAQKAALAKGRQKLAAQARNGPNPGDAPQSGTSDREGIA